MVVTKYTSDTIKQTGSPELLVALPDGMINRIKSHYGYSYPYTHRILNGKQLTANGMPEAAMRIIEMWKEEGINNKVNQILNDYGPINKVDEAGK
tara:strand:+ start:6638 stop:6922 length:285 start_codon:yes stop_codon:yes gene_type:complete